MEKFNLLLWHYIAFFSILYVVLILWIILGKEMVALDCKANDQFDSTCIDPKQVGLAYAIQYCKRFGKLEGQAFIPDCWDKFAEAYGGAYCTRTDEHWKSDTHCMKFKYCQKCRVCAANLRTTPSRFDEACSKENVVFKEFAMDYCLDFAEQGELSITSCESFKEYRNMQKGLRLVASRSPAKTTGEGRSVIWVGADADEEKQRLRQQFWTHRESDGDYLELKTSSSDAFADMFNSSIKRSGLWTRHLVPMHWELPSQLIVIVEDGGEERSSIDAKEEWLAATAQSILRTADDNDNSLGELVGGSGKSWPKFILDAVTSAGFVIPSQPAMESFLQETGVLPENAANSYHFFGEWLARAYIVDELAVQLPFALHPAIYDSLAAGEVIAPQFFKSDYDEQDVIEPCEWLVQLKSSRASADVGPYGYMQCDKLMWDPDTKTYLDANCKLPLYRSELWESLNLYVWGPEAKAFPEESLDPEADVPQDQARKYTVAFCRRVYEDRYVAPVKQIVQGFNQIVARSDLEAAFEKVVGRHLQVMVEGRKELELHGPKGILEAITWDGDWTDDRKARMVHALEKLSEDRDIDGLLMFVRFVTGKVMPPSGGWKKLKHRAGAGLWLKLFPNTDPTATCTYFTSNTCFNRLNIPFACVEEGAPLYDHFLESLANGQQQ